MEECRELGSLGTPLETQCLLNSFGQNCHCSLPTHKNSRWKMEQSRMAFGLDRTLQSACLTWSSVLSCSSRKDYCSTGLKAIVHNNFCFKSYRAV